MFKSGFVTIIGRPNVGKSTLINSLIGEKLASTTAKPQTTRSRVMGIYNSEDSQIIFLDTPGIHKPKHKLGEYMMKAVDTSLQDVDVVLYVTDETFSVDKFQRSEDALKKTDAKVFVIVNKTDLIGLPRFDAIKKQVEVFSYVDAVLGISAISGRGVDSLVETIKESLPEGPKYYPDSMYTDESEKSIVSEMIREKILNYMQDEIPHGVAVVVERFKRRTKKEIIDIEASIICEKKSHKGMIIGKNGRKLKGIGSAARKDIEEFLQSKVFLKLWVKVKPGWRDDKAEMRRQGFDIDKI